MAWSFNRPREPQIFGVFLPACRLFSMKRANFSTSASVRAPPEVTIPHLATGSASHSRTMSSSSSSLLKGYFSICVLLNPLCEQKRQFILQFPLFALMIKQISILLPKKCSRSSVAPAKSSSSLFSINFRASSRRNPPCSTARSASSLTPSLVAQATCFVKFFHHTLGQTPVERSNFG